MFKNGLNPHVIAYICPMVDDEPLGLYHNLVPSRSVEICTSSWFGGWWWQWWKSLVTELSSWEMHGGIAPLQPLPQIPWFERITDLKAWLGLRLPSGAMPWNLSCGVDARIQNFSLQEVWLSWEKFWKIFVLFQARNPKALSVNSPEVMGPRCAQGVTVPPADA